MTDQANPASGSAQSRESILERWPSWIWLSIFFGTFVLAWALSRLAPAIFYDRFFGKYFVEPILTDGGYNAINTTGNALILLVLIIWAYRWLAEKKESMDLSMFLAILPFLILGSVYRVLEDSDLFAPFDTRHSCVPDLGGGFLDTCFGVFFITPIIWVIFAFMAAGFLALGHHAKLIAQRSTVAKGLQFHAGALLVLVLLYTALFYSNPTWIRYLQNPFWIVLAAGLAYFVAHRHAAMEKRIDPHVQMFSGGLFVLLVGSKYTLDWMSGAWWGSGPALEPRWWIFWALVLAPGLLTVLAYSLGRVFSNHSPFGPTDPISEGAEPDESPTTPMTLYVALLLLASVGLFVSMLGSKRIEEAAAAGTLFSNAGALIYDVATVLAGPAVVALAIVVAVRLVRHGVGFHRGMIFFAAPVNLLMIFGQMADALMTSIGIDGYGYSEKHVLPRFLIEVTREANLPFGFSSWATAIVMLPLKLFIVLIVVWIIDVSVEEPRKNLIGLIKLAIIMVGLSPAIRNATRLAMGT